MRGYFTVKLPEPTNIFTIENKKQNIFIDSNGKRWNLEDFKYLDGKQIYIVKTEKDTGYLAFKFNKDSITGAYARLSRIPPEFVNKE
jgi:hypothetical protein